MSAIDTIKEISRATSTAGLSKDVIDLLEKKIALLTEQVTTLETENANLKKKVANLEQQLASVRPKGQLQPDAIRFLKLLFEHDGLTTSQVASSLGISKGIAEYHRDILLKSDMIGYPSIMYMGQEPGVHLLPKGRAFLVEGGQV